MPAAPSDWSEPFLRQAQADLNVAIAIPPELRGCKFLDFGPSIADES